MLQNEMVGKAGPRTLFIIENAVGFDMQPFSWFQSDSEVLLPAGSEMVVKSHLDAGNGLTLITLQMIRTEHCIVDLNSHLSTPAPPPAGPGRDCPVDGLEATLSAAKLSFETRKRVRPRLGLRNYWIRNPGSRTS